ncbi:MAG: hypothetical protein RBR69_09785 [Candidatus Cloacimonadaceae bacterium]|jgi:hypothetical protein|nr:hypothetical protein [Candidatus Cloacimonadota bacterium]MDY0128408.1 hypothetical protein [Candidatus Cloacimonadaceae bacterium]MCB5254353.1 hypothetical protein [Candidatus Cloacimonadota bacterium]MCK9177940.1 hypothetical protein [Candidatus Cloacimonadota bacterium]MCK9242659.1 hypothetical protein [Candidatus Cloacimonadota bacterium]
MKKRSIVLILTIFAVCALGAQTFEWGIKYQGGVSALTGDDDSYLLRFDLDDYGSDYGYLQAESQTISSEYAQGAGLYMMKRLSKKVDSVWIQSEILWQRYAFSYDFEGKIPDTDNALLIVTFQDTLKGSIYHSADYISIPVLFKIRQEMSEGLGGDQFQGAYVYFGPAYSFLLGNSSSSKAGVKDLEQSLQSYVEANPGMSSERYENGADVLVSHKFDIVVGTGFQLKDLFKLGLGSDTFSIDLRGDISIFKLGDAKERKDFRLISGMLSLAYKF